MPHIIPAILEKNFTEVKRKILAAQNFIPAGGRIQLDVADGNFVSSITWANPPDLLNIDIKAALSIHLMVADPRQEFEKWLINPVREIIVHYEALGVSEKEKNDNFSRVQKKIKAAGKEFALAINPTTSYEVVRNYIDNVDAILFLAVDPGFQGSEFVVETPARVRALRGSRKNAKIGIDGGISDKTLPLFNDSGADYFVSGSYIWKSENPREAYLKLVEMGKKLR